MKKLIIQIILAGIIIFLGYKCYESIKIPQQFKVIKEQRYARIADRLKDIRTAQEAYKGVYGKYTGQGALHKSAGLGIGFGHGIHSSKNVT